MPVYEYRGQSINISENDSEYLGYFEAAREHRLVVKKCLDCGLLRGEPGPGCPWCTSLGWEWHEVSGNLPSDFGFPVDVAPDIELRCAS